MIFAVCPTSNSLTFLSLYTLGNMSSVQSASPVVNNNSKMQLLNLPKKRTMVKDRVGCVRTSTYALPTDPGHVYGFKRPSDPEGSGDSKCSRLCRNPFATC